MDDEATLWDESPGFSGIDAMQTVHMVVDHDGVVLVDEKAEGGAALAQKMKLETETVEEVTSEAQTVVKNFVRYLVKGQPTTMLVVGGGRTSCIAYLDVDLTTLSLQKAATPDTRRRAVPLEEVLEVIVGELGGREFDLDTDDFSVTLLLESGQALAFQLEGEEERDTFAFCMTMFVDARHAVSPKATNRRAEPKRR